MAGYRAWRPFNGEDLKNQMNVSNVPMIRSGQARETMNLFLDFGGVMHPSKQTFERDANLRRVKTGAG